MPTTDEAMQQAIAAGDYETAVRIGLDADTRTPAPASLHASALWYAEQGHPVFPLQPGTKVPFGRSHGCHDATTDTAQVDAWWTATPDANIGLATGVRVDVVDIDGPAGQASRAADWDTIFGKVDADNVGKVLTPRPGGMHIYLPATGRGNHAGLRPSVDYRGRGGYVVAPPSSTPQGTYRWLGQPHLPTGAA